MYDLCHFETFFSQGSVATRLRSDENLYIDLAENVVLFPAVKEF